MDMPGCVAELGGWAEWLYIVNVDATVQLSVAVAQQYSCSKGLVVWQREKAVRSSSARTPKLQLAAEQPLTGECWIPPK